TTSQQQPLMSPLVSRPSGPASLPHVSCPLRRTYEQLCGSDPKMRARLLGDVAIRWIEEHAWRGPLELLLGRAARELGLDRVGPLEGLNERQQSDWDSSRRKVYGKFLAIAEAATCKGAESRPTDPRVTPAAISRFQDISAYLAEGLAAYLLGQSPPPIPPPSPLPPSMPRPQQQPLSPPLPRPNNFASQCFSGSVARAVPNAAAFSAALDRSGSCGLREPVPA
ncbi:hypothetical protein Agub_g6518, partial [Astrephomene gubernaculifera]